MNENSSKQVLLSVIGIAVLVVAVVGVSFAFFTYSKTGANNTLTTGSIFFNFTEGNAINLTNEFPRTDDSGKSLTKGVNGALEFSVVGYDGSSKGIEYTVYALPGAAETGKTRFQDSQIKLYLEAESSNSSTITNNFATPTKISSLTDTGLEIYDQEIKKYINEKKVETINFSMRIDDNGNLICDYPEGNEEPNLSINSEGLLVYTY